MHPFAIALGCACAIVVLLYLAKGNESDPNKRPNYAVVFMASAALAFGVVWLFAPDAQTGGGGLSGNTAVVMKEIDIGEPDF